VTHVAVLIQSQVLTVLNAVLGLAILVMTYVPSVAFVTPDQWNTEGYKVTCAALPGFLATGMSVACSR
jgi:hypothetical protein